MAFSWYSASMFSTALLVASLAIGQEFHVLEDFQIFEAILPSPFIADELEGFEHQPIPLMGPWRHTDEETGDFDIARCIENIWRPDVGFGVPEGYGSEERYGIPPGYTGWVILDYEQWNLPYRLVDFLALIATTRQLRPQALIALYWKPNLNGGSVYDQTEALIISQVDAIAPPTYLLNSLENLAAQLYNREQRVRHCLELGQAHGKEVFPIVWKRYAAGVDEQGNKVQRLLAPDVFDAVLDLAMVEHEGAQADGIILWGNDNLVLFNPDGNVVHPDTPTQYHVDVTDLASVLFVNQGTP